MFALLYQSWSYILRPANCMARCRGRHLAENRNFEKYRETSHKPDAVGAFYETKNVLQSSVEKILINFFSVQQFSFLFEDFRKKIDQTVNVFHSRFCCLLKEPKRPVITEGTVPELLDKTPYRGASSNWEHSGAPGNAPDSISKL